MDFPSSSSEKTYTVSVNIYGSLSCNCPGWTKRVKRIGGKIYRSCRHVQETLTDHWPTPLNTLRANFSGRLTSAEIDSSANVLSVAKRDADGGNEYSHLPPSLSDATRNKTADRIADEVEKMRRAELEPADADEVLDEVL